MIKLDFTITDAFQRAQIAREICEQNPNLTNDELELLTTYCVCGVAPGESKSPVQRKEIFLDNAKRPEESLDALLETPSFTEPSQNTTHYKIPKPNFTKMRGRVREALNPNELAHFEELWQRIARLERLLNIAKKKDASPPPTPDELAQAQKITPHRAYLIKKIVLELKREQYTLYDQFMPQLQRHELIQVKYRGGEQDLSYQEIENALPLGLWRPHSPIFETPWIPNSLLPNTKINNMVDFRNPTHIYRLVEQREKLETDSLTNPESLIPQLFATLDYYVNLAHLEDEQQDILKLKYQRWTNGAIQRFIKEKYGVNHSESYISTIFTKQICGGIAAAAQLHEDTFNERGKANRFKQCKDCGDILLMDYRNFTKQSRNRDGWSCRCKFCEKKKRIESNLKRGEQKKK